MGRSYRSLVGTGIVSLAVLAGACSPQQEEAAAEPLVLAGGPCADPPVEHCPDENCAVEVVTSGGPAVEPTTGRNYFLDYSCDLKQGEPVNLILSLHGGGSYGNWQRHYFPILDNLEEHNIVVATPHAPPRVWLPSADDEYLQTLTTSLIDEIGRENIASFWLVGHSQGGMTSNRLVCTDYFADKVDGWLSLSGGRIGPAELAAGFGAPGATPANSDEDDDEPATPPIQTPNGESAFPPIEGVNGPEAARPGAAVTPTCDINYIFTTGELEVGPLPETSPWAEKYNCQPRVRLEDIVDEKAGYVRSSRDGEPNPAWGVDARPGTAEVYVYPQCEGDRLVADVVRLDKGHTEGLEPKVTTALIDMMMSAPGGKLQSSAAAE